MKWCGWSRFVFSAHAEVVPPSVVISFEAQCILRARGGSSELVGTIAAMIGYSPRTRR